MLTPHEYHGAYESFPSFPSVNVMVVSLFQELRQQNSESSLGRRRLKEGISRVAFLVRDALEEFFRKSEKCQSSGGT